MPASDKERHARAESAGYARRYWARTMASFQASSLVLGVAAAHATHSNVVVAGVAGLVAGAMSMAAGEYVSVHSQADTEQAELERERTELKAHNKGEHKELAAIYVARGLDPSLAKQVARNGVRGDDNGSDVREHRFLQPDLSGVGSVHCGI